MSEVELVPLLSSNHSHSDNVVITEKEDLIAWPLYLFIGCVFFLGTGRVLSRDRKKNRRKRPDKATQ
jgi:hypothetical protein